MLQLPNVHTYTIQKTRHAHSHALLTSLYIVILSLNQALPYIRIFFGFSIFKTCIPYATYIGIYMVVVIYSD